MLDAGIGSVQHWTRPVPASNESGVAAATATTGSRLPSSPPPVLHLLAVPSPRYSHPLGTKPSNSLPRRPFLRQRVFSSPYSHCHRRLPPRLRRPLDKPTNSPDIPHGLPTHAMPAIACQSWSKACNRRCHVLEPNNKTNIHLDSQDTTPIFVRIQSFESP